MRQIGAGKARIEHLVDDIIERQAGMRAVVVELIVPVAVARPQGPLVDSGRIEVADGLGEVSAIAGAHMAPLVGFEAGSGFQTAGGGPQCLHYGKRRTSHCENGGERVGV